MKKQVAITGSSSATGLWIARAFSKSGWQVHSLCQNDEKDYSGKKKERLKWLKEVSFVHFDLPAQGPEMLGWIKTMKPNIWVHHHHYTHNYRLPTYDIHRALKEGLEPLETLAKALSQSNCEGIIFTGTIFEKDPKPSPYAQSKTQVGTQLEKQAKKLGIPFSKIFVPDPVGPTENEDRFIPELLRSARQRETFRLFHPEDIGNHVPLDTLGDVYEKCAQNLIKKKGEVLAPEGWVGRQRDWLQVVIHSLLKPLNLRPETDQQESESCQINQGNKDINWMEFWYNYKTYVKTGKPWSDS